MNQQFTDVNNRYYKKQIPNIQQHLTTVSYESHRLCLNELKRIINMIAAETPLYSNTILHISGIILLS